MGDEGRSEFAPNPAGGFHTDGAESSEKYPSLPVVLGWHL